MAESMSAMVKVGAGAVGALRVAVPLALADGGPLKDVPTVTATVAASPGVMR
jgi:hypothetical protein